MRTPWSDIQLTWQCFTKTFCDITKVDHFDEFKHFFQINEESSWTLVVFCFLYIELNDLNTDPALKLTDFRLEQYGGCVSLQRETTCFCSCIHNLSYSPLLFDLVNSKDTEIKHSELWSLTLGFLHKAFVRSQSSSTQLFVFLLSFCLENVISPTHSRMHTHTHKQYNL